MTIWEDVVTRDVIFPKSSIVWSSPNIQNIFIPKQQNYINQNSVRAKQFTFINSAGYNIFSNGHDQGAYLILQGHWTSLHKFDIP